MDIESKKHKIVLNIIVSHRFYDERNPSETFHGSEACSSESLDVFELCWINTASVDRHNPIPGGVLMT